MEAQQDDSAPECDMHASMMSLHSARSSRAGSSVTLHDPMTQSLYGRAIVDTVMQPQMVSYGDASDEERLPPPRDPQSLRVSRLSLMSQSVHPSLMTQSIYEPATEDRDEEWADFRLVTNRSLYALCFFTKIPASELKIVGISQVCFSLEEDSRPMSMDAIASRMSMSMHEARPRPATSSYSRSVSAPRRRLHLRKETSRSPARDMRTEKIMSAVSVLLDELDADGLRAVIEHAQDRMKKRW
ncbi:hypothetical protein COOONC_01211 [Cooperia oncophora]